MPPIVIVKVNDVDIDGQTSVTVSRANVLVVVTDITNRAGIGFVINPVFPPVSHTGEAFDSGGGFWKLRWLANTLDVGNGQTLLVTDPNDTSQTAQITLNVTT